MINIHLEGRSRMIATALLSGSPLEADAYPLLHATRDLAAQVGARAFLLDFSAVKRVSPSGLGALVELAAIAGGPELVLCGLPADAVTRLQRLGLDHMLHHYPDRATALASPALMRHRLAGLKAVVLAAGKGTRAQPLTDATPKAMFDILGAPVVTRILDDLAQAGIAETVVSTGHLAPMIAESLASRRFGAMSVFVLAEGRHGPAGWQGIPVGSATTLGRLRTEGNLHGDTLVMNGDALCDIDIASLYAQHCRSGADVTIAGQPVSSEVVARHGVIVADETGRITSFLNDSTLAAAGSRLANTGICILGPRALACAETRPGTDIATHLLPAVLAQGLHVQVFDQPFQWADIGCPKDYFRALTLALSGRIDGVAPVGTQSGSGIWVADGAFVAPDALLNGPVHIGQGATIHGGVELYGPVVIGAGAVIEGPCVIRSSLILPDTRVWAGTIVDQVIACGAWVVPYAEPDALPLPRHPMAENISDFVATQQDWAAE